MGLLNNRIGPFERILVTGGSGFVGKSLVSILRKTEDRICILAPSSSELNLLSYDNTCQYLRKNRIDCVISLAARLGGVGIVSNNPLFYLESNLAIYYNIVKASRENGVKRFITLGSSCCYSDNISLPAKEESLWEKRPENTYGICKLILLEHLQNQQDMDWVYLIPANIYGPGDHFGKENSHLIPATVMKYEQAKMFPKKAITVWDDGSQTRDFIYIVDLVNIILNSLTDDRYCGRPINVATSVGITIKEVVYQIRSLLGVESIDIEWDTSKPTGTLKKILSNERLLQIEPGYQFRTFNDGIRDTMDWYIKYYNLYKR